MHERSRKASDRELELGSPAMDDASVTEEGARRSHSVGARHSFNRLYEAIGGEVKYIDAPADLAGLRRNDVVELQGVFERSPVNRMLESLFDIMNMMKSVRSPGMDVDELQEMVAMMATIFPNAGTQSDDVPLVSEPDSPGCLFVADRQFCLRPVSDLNGEMTVFGKVKRVLGPDQSVDMLQQLNLLPPALRGNAALTQQLRTGLEELFSTWPSELSGPMDKSNLSFNGPAAIILPVAVYT